MSTFDEGTKDITRITFFQNQLLDHTGHTVRGLTRDDKRMLVDEIQRLRQRVGWKPLDMTGRTRRK
jgi:hypothetical protein